jgi:hypothetical protein
MSVLANLTVVFVEDGVNLRITAVELAPELKVPRAVLVVILPYSVTKLLLVLWVTRSFEA